ncbi:hypothetical protein KJ966_20670 [bacterium]|nr:hypothetical protein [bacterium]
MKCNQQRNRLPQVSLIAYLAISLLIGGQLLAEVPTDNQTLETFNHSYDAGDLNTVSELGPELINQYPEDEIIQFKLTHALFRAARFEAVLEIAAKNQIISNLPYWYSKVEDLGFYTWSFNLWQLQIMSLVATGQLDAALNELDKMQIYNVSSMDFTRVLIYHFQGKGRLASEMEQQILKKHYIGDSYANLIQQRILPAMSDPAYFPSFLQTAVSHQEVCWLKALMGFELYLKGDKETALIHLNEALQEENTVTAQSFPIMLISLISADRKQLLKQAQQALLQERWQIYAKTWAEFLDAMVTKNDYLKSMHLCRELTRQNPNDKDLTVLLAIFHMIQEEWQQAETVIQEMVKTPHWNSENFISAKLYLPILHLILNKKKDYQKSLALFEDSDFPQKWKPVATMIEHPDRYQEIRKQYETTNSELTGIVTLRALMAEIEGDYTLAEDLYFEMITDERFAYYFEYYLADRRLQVIAPLAAIQRLDLN